jgi:hypothetical protein
MTQPESGGIPEDLLRRIISDIGARGMGQILASIEEAETRGMPGILVEGEASDSPYLMMLDGEGVDFVYQGQGPFWLPLSTLVEMGPGEAA